MCRKSYEISMFICPICGKTLPIPRMKSMRREKEHIKDLWCYNCKKVVKMTKIRNRDYYQFKYKDKIISYY